MTDKNALGAVNIAYVFVHDQDYPRNRRIRQHLEKSGANVDVLSVHEIGVANPLAPAYVRRLSEKLKGYDLVVLSEFQLRYALSLGIAARLKHTKVVVDGFVGRYETAIGDWGQASPISLKAMIYRAVDASSLLVSDLFLIDNEHRANLLRASRWAKIFRKTIISLPVGAPGWARPLMAEPAGAPGSALKVLYYGNYIPLHGLDVVLEAVEAYSTNQPIELSMVGNGVGRAHFEAEARQRHIESSCSFIDHVAEEELQKLIANADVVLGVFGRSPKAKSVIANKVWQSLAVGKPVVTRESPALSELSFVPNEQLIQVPASPGDLKEALIQVAARKRKNVSGTFASTHEDLGNYVTEKFDEFVKLLREKLIP